MLTVTNTSLLNGLLDSGNDRVWSDFYGRYQPILVSFSRRLGLSDADAQDAAQEALTAFASSYREGAYDRVKGRLRTWLMAITTYKVRDIQRKRGRQMVITDEADHTRFLNQIPDERSISSVWDAEWARAMMGECLAQVRREVKPQTMRAFELFAIEGWPASKVAAELGITENAVWIAKNRVTTRLRKVQEFLEENW
jgi:RNA polymerase sigma-70 factor (ECF subfamily)